MATIKWEGGDSGVEIKPAGSGKFDTLGFFGANFGFSIRVGEYNNTSFSTNDDGTSNSGAVPNLRWASNTGVFVASETTPSLLRAVDDFEATLHIQMTHGAAVKTQNSALRCFDGNNIANNPSGVTCQAFEIKSNGSGDTTWTNIKGSGSTLPFDDHTTPTGTHDWYAGISASPQSIGEKKFGFYFETEFL